MSSGSQHTNQYIHFASHAPLQHKLATVRSLTRRAMIIPSTPEAKREEDKRIKDALALNGYPDWAIRQGTYKPKAQPTNNNNNSNNNKNNNNNENNNNNNDNNNKNKFLWWLLLLLLLLLLVSLLLWLLL